jgi:hypothetical protein
LSAQRLTSRGNADGVISLAQLVQRVSDVYVITTRRYGKTSWLNLIAGGEPQSP